MVTRVVFAVKCTPGVNKFAANLENKSPFTINVKPGGTYWLECKLLDHPVFRHVSKDEARRDLAKINKYVVEQVKDDAVEPEIPEVDSTTNFFVCGVSNKTYVYTKYEKYTQLSCDGIKVISKYLRYRTEDKTSMGVTYINDEEFPYESYRKDKVNRSVDFDENGQVLATFFYNGPLSNDIQLQNGTVYVFAKVDATHWTYSLDGEVVIRGALQAGLKKSIQIEVLKELQNPSVFMCGLGYGVYLIAHRNSSGMAIVSSLLRM
jgi:hypothetical protein